MVRYKLLTKPTQSGKTFSLLKHTTDILEDNPKAVHIILTDNSLIQLEQLFDRIVVVIGKGTMVLSSETDISIDRLQKCICENKIKYILLCANNAQITKINKMIKTITRKCSGRSFYIWIDEGDKIAEPENISIFDKWMDYNNIKGLAYITATPHSLILRYNKMFVLKVKEAYDKKRYNRWSDCKVITLPEREDYMTFIKDAFKKREAKKGDVWFIAPGNLTDTHEDVTRYLNGKGFYVLVVNALGELISPPKGKKFPLEGKNALSDRINYMYDNMNMYDKKFAIVGYNRLGRGITIQSNGMFITHAIFPTIPQNKASIYQLAGRLCGNYKQYKGFKKPTIFCTEYFDDVAYELENVAIKISKLPMIDKKIYNSLEKKYQR